MPNANRLEEWLIDAEASDPSGPLAVSLPSRRAAKASIDDLMAALMAKAQDHSPRLLDLIAKERCAAILNLPLAAFETLSGASLSVRRRTALKLAQQLGIKQAEFSKVFSVLPEDAESLNRAAFGFGLALSLAGRSGVLTKSGFQALQARFGRDMADFALSAQPFLRSATSALDPDETTFESEAREALVKALAGHPIGCIVADIFGLPLKARGAASPLEPVALKALGAKLSPPPAQEEEEEAES